MSRSREIVLARRAKFVALAVAGVGIACGKEKVEPPQPCLSVAIFPDAEPPRPCLSVAIVPDAGPPPIDTSVDAGATDAGKADAGKTTVKTKPAMSAVPCLLVAPEPESK
jgi:hypothetical protein